MRLRRAESWAGGRITQPWYTAISSRRTYKHTPLIIGGLEASLRRLGHYDYWSNKVKRSILLDSGADLLLYGMGERSIVAVAEGLRSGIDIKDLTYIDGTVYKTKDPDSVYDGITLPSYEENSVPARNPMPTVFIHNIAIRIHLQQNGSLSLIQINAMSCKTAIQTTDYQ